MFRLPSELMSKVDKHISGFSAVEIHSKQRFGLSKRPDVNH